MQKSTASIVIIAGMTYLCAMLLTALPMLVCLFWAIFLLTNYVETRRPDKGRLTVFMLVATLLYGGHYVFFKRFESIIPASDTFYVFANLAVFPLYLKYIESLTVGRSPIRAWHLLFVLPPYVMASAVLLAYLQMTPEATSQFIDTYLYQGHMEGLEGAARVQAIFHTVAKVMFALQILPIFLIGNRCIHRFEKQCEQLRLNVSLHPLRYMLLLFAVVSAFSFVANIVGRHHFTGSPLLLSIPSLAFSLFLYYVGYLGYRQDVSFRDLEWLSSQKAEEVPTVTVAASQPAQAVETAEQPNPIDSLPLRQRIDHLMKVEHMYLQPNLKISDLAKRLGSNRNYIYEAVNREMGMSFSDYVNRLRICHSQQLIRQNPNMLLAEVALKSGFSSTISFYRAFKKYVGCAPKDWKPGEEEKEN